MQLTKKQIRKYRELYNERFGVELSNKEVLEKTQSLVRMVELIYKPMTKKEFGQLQNRRMELKINHQKYAG